MERVATDFEATGVLGHNIVFYLLSIDPQHWTVFGNRPQPLIEEWKPLYLSYVKQAASLLQPNEDSDQLLLDHLSTSIPPGEAFPLFNNRQKNLVECEANASIVSSVRNMNPQNGAVLWIRWASKVMTAAVHKVWLISSAGTPLTAIGLRLYSTASLKTTGVQVEIALKLKLG
jgi:hypothetical protein